MTNKALKTFIGYLTVGMMSILILAGCAPEAEKSIFETVKIPMPDGITLEGDVFLPDGDGPFPVVLEITPYNRASFSQSFRAEHEYWTNNGYAFMLVDSRGQWKSEGPEATFFEGDRKDSHHIVNWIGDQPWSDGNVGMRGSSYTGTNHWYAASKKPEALKCIAPYATAAAPFENIVYRGGALTGWSLTWPTGSGYDVDDQFGKVDWDELRHSRPVKDWDLKAFDKRVPLYQKILDHNTQDSYWKDMELGPEDYQAISIPVLAITGWFDGTQIGTIKHFTAQQTYSNAREDNHLIIGPWEHGTLPDGGYNYKNDEPVKKVGAFPELPDQAFVKALPLLKEFYDWCLKGAEKPDLPPVKAYLTGSDVWQNYDTWPPREAKEVSFYLINDKTTANSTLSQVLPDREDTASYSYDPANPISATLPDGGPIGSLPQDLGEHFNRPDVLVFQTAPLEEGLTVAGPAILHLTASSSAYDTDFISTIENVKPDGSAFTVASQGTANIRAKFRNGFEKAELLTPGKMESYVLNYHHLGHTFKKGHRIRISVFSSLFPTFTINPNTGNPIATDTDDPVVAVQTISLGGSSPSRLSLSVVDTP